MLSHCICRPEWVYAVQAFIAGVLTLGVCVVMFYLIKALRDDNR